MPATAGAYDQSGLASTLCCFASRCANIHRPVNCSVAAKSRWKGASVGHCCHSDVLHYFAFQPELYTPKVVEIVLKIINRIILKDSEMKVCVPVCAGCCYGPSHFPIAVSSQESLSMIGIMPIVVQFASPACVTAVRYQVGFHIPFVVRLVDRNACFSGH